MQSVGGARAPPTARPCPPSVNRLMTRPKRFEEFRYLGDKRSQRVYDLDHADDPEVASQIDELVASEQFAAFSPDTLAEARNRGYRPVASARRSD